MSKIISPIAIDMGAKNTGVYYAQYEQDSTFEQIDKHGQVLVYGNYTPLLSTRTANRHVRRGYQRKKLAKRLLKVILNEHFNFPAEQHTQALGFLMNRRGFSFLEENYSKEYLNNLPDGVWGELSNEVKKLFDGKENIADQLMEIAINDRNNITKIFEAIQNIKGYKEYKDLQKDAVYYDYIVKISNACDTRCDDNEIEEGIKEQKKLSKTSKWIVERLTKDNNINLVSISDKNLLEQLNALDKQQAKDLKNQLPDIQVIQEKTKQDIKNSIWNFDFSDFELDKKEDDLSFDIDDNDIEEKEKDKKEQAHYKAHLHHFCYAVYKINQEIISGGRHRSKFFDEINEDLKKYATDDFLNDVGLDFKIKNGKPTKEKAKNPRHLKNFILAINENEKLDIDKLHKLVCHISNFELKPLRAYFNNEDYKNGDELDKKNLTKIASRWFLKHWIVTEEKDNKDKVDSYKELRIKWQAYSDKNNIIDFWLQTDPVLTIPPYQAMLNRHPPKCQSLLLNIDYLNNQYPSWKDWLNKLNPDKEYKKKLELLQSGKGKRKTKNGKEMDGRLIGDDLIKLRQLQFILDTAKKRDNYKLNEIWSIYHQWQKTKTGDEQKLQNAVNESKLPKELKESLTFDGFKEEDSFAHFLNKYYKERRKTRDGRYFLIQEKKEKWLTDDKLLTLCTHKPRQKKHQWQLDLAAVLGVNVDSLKDKIGKNPEDYFKAIKGFVSNCKNAAKAQKDHRGELKLKIYHELANKPKGTLAKLANKCDELKQALIKETGIKKILADKQPNEFNQKIALVFKFAQIHNIVFKDRSGFSKTCPVCSTDNAFRMQENSEGIATASRLPALSIRLIDGVVMRVCDAIARQVAVTKWNDIKDDLQKGNKVHIPLILEQNRFEFEPSLAKIKGQTVTVKEDKENKTVRINTAKGLVVLKDDRDSEFNEKENRIKQAAQDISAYSGMSFSNGEIDHIIPQASKYGTLNDEANLIYLSQDDNQTKSNQTKFLGDLHDEYKTNIFGTNSVAEIKDFIYQKLGNDTESDNFSFGKYLSFINLNEDQKKAFRHALFLQDDDPLKQKVINALQNRNRTIVNGTQRYLAQCIADKIHRIARKTKQEKQIEFDYFEYSARFDDPKSTYNLRKKYGIDKPKKQPLYSHLIDAQLAFLLAAQDHQGKGSMGIKFLDDQNIWKCEADKSTGEVLPSQLFNASDVGEDKLKKVDLSPKDSNQKIIDIENQNNEKKQDLSKIFKRPIFKQQAIGERYKPIVKFEDNWYLGYPMTIKGGIYNCDDYCKKIDKKSDIDKLKDISDSKYYQLTTDNEQIKIWTIKKIDKKYKQIDKDSHKYFSQLNPKYSDDERKEVMQIKFILDKCKYYVAKDAVTNAPKVLNKQGAKKYPFYKNWVDFDNAWREEVGDDYAVKSGGYDLLNSVIQKKWNEFCKKRFAPPENQLRNRHQVKGKKYTMTSLGTPSGTVFRVNRNNQDVYQAVPLDTNIIDKDKSNFLIKHSKNLALASKKADEDLSKEVLLKTINIDLTINSTQDIFKEKFINDDIQDIFSKNKKTKSVTVRLTNNSVDISNMPVIIFKKFINNFSKWNKEDSILFKQDDDNKPRADNNKLKGIIKLPYRSGDKFSIKDIKMQDEYVDFSLSCRKDKAEKFEKSLIK